MKLYEIAIREGRALKVGHIPIIYPKGTVSIPAEDSDEESGKAVRVGDGWQATVYKFPKHTNSIVKYANLKSLDDSYVQFVNMVLDNPDNPFFPRIYNAKIYYTERNLPGWKITAPDGFMLVIQMEKLHPIQSDKLWDTAHHVFKRLGIEGDSPADLYNQFSQKNRRHWLKERTTNPQFKQALEALEPLFDEHKSDLHQQNVMIRLTSSGPQLVIIDPFHPT